MNVVIFGLVPHSPHFETQLELIQDHMDAGDEVTYVSCDRALTHCDSNPENDRVFCLACEKKRESGLGCLSKTVKMVRLSNYINKESLSGVELDFLDLVRLAEYKSRGYDCGEAVASSLQSHARTIYPSMHEHRDFVRRAMSSTVLLYGASLTALKEMTPDIVYIFNGRAATGRAPLRAAQSLGIDFFTHERGSSIDSYMLAKNTVPHDVDYRGEEIRRHWELNPDEFEKREIAARFYSNMRKGKLAYREANYIKHQEAGFLPEGWREAKERIVFFSSTETERAALSGFYKRRIYASLMDMVERIVNDLRAENFQGIFVLRMHPNSRDEFEKMKPLLDGLKSAKFFHLIPPAEKVDSYALLDSADKVLVVTSTIGMEAVYANIPCISLERSNYDKLGATYSPASHEEVMSLLVRYLEPKDTLGALMYGYYTLTFGRKFNRIEMQGQNKCSFNGRKIRSPRWLDWLMKARKRIRQWV